MKTALYLGAFALLAGCVQVVQSPPQPRDTAPRSWSTPASDRGTPQARLGSGGGGAERERPIGRVAPEPPSARIGGGGSGGSDACGAGRLQHLIGQRVPDRIDAPGPVRIVRPNDAVTMDYNPERLTVVISGDSRRIVQSLSCG